MDDFTFYLIYKRRKPSKRRHKIWHEFRDLFNCMFCIPCPPTFESFMRKTVFLPPTVTYDFRKFMMHSNGEGGVIGRNFDQKLCRKYEHFESSSGKSFFFKHGCDFMYKYLICDEILKFTRIRATFVSNFTTNSHLKLRRREFSPAKLAACLIETQRIQSENDFIILHCHCNKVDLGLQMPFNIYLSWRLNCPIFSFDYSGYGLSAGQPSECNLRRNVVEAYYFLIDVLKIQPRKIIVFGESLGTVAALHLASKAPEIGAVILVGVLVSAFRLLFPRMRSNLPIDQLQNFDNIPKVRCPTLLIHGALDKVAPILQVQHFMDLCPNAKFSLIIPDGQHDDLMSHAAYWTRLELFIRELGVSVKSEDVNYCSMFCPGLSKS
uniref:Uncharacterized protein n=1 Tax=Romanomermis culicivorax TaxID=13658 RepID=A0A915L2H6_ROMCU